jgi:hypothetical protein
MTKKSIKKGTIVPHTHPDHGDPGVMHTDTGPYSQYENPHIWQHDDAMEKHISELGIRPENKPLRIKPIKRRSR